MATICSICLNTTVHSITGFPPYYLVFGFHPRLNIDNSVGKPELYGVSKFDKSLEQSVRLLKEARKLARKKLIEYGEKMKERVDAHRVIANFEVGDRVWLLNAVRPSGVTEAFYDPWTGHFIVRKNLGLCS